MGIQAKGRRERGYLGQNYEPSFFSLFRNYSIAPFFLFFPPHFGSYNCLPPSSLFSSILFFNFFLSLIPFQIFQKFRGLGFRVQGLLIIISSLLHLIFLISISLKIIYT